MRAKLTKTLNAGFAAGQRMECVIECTQADLDILPEEVSAEIVSDDTPLKDWTAIKQ